MYRDVMRKTKKIIPATAKETTIQPTRNINKRRQESEPIDTRRYVRHPNQRSSSGQSNRSTVFVAKEKNVAPKILNNNNSSLKSSKNTTESVQSLNQIVEDYHDILKSVKKIDLNEDVVSDMISLNNNVGTFRKRNIDNVEYVNDDETTVSNDLSYIDTEDMTGSVKKRKKVCISKLPITPTESKMEFLAALDPLEPLLSLKDNIEKQQTKDTIPAAIKNFTPDNIALIIKSITNDRVLKTTQYSYMLGFMNELQNLQPELVEYNLKLIKTRITPNEDALCCLLRILIKSDIKWPSEQLDVILNTFYDLDRNEIVRDFNVKGIIQTTINRINPREMALFCNYLADNKKMPTKKYIYLSKYIERLNKLPIKQINEYMTFLRLHGFIDRNDIQTILDFVCNTRTHWKPHEYQNLETILKGILKQRVNPLPPTATALTEKLNPGTGGAITIATASVSGTRPGHKPQLNTTAADNVMKTTTTTTTTKSPPPSSSLSTTKRKRNNKNSPKMQVNVKPIVHHYDTRNFVYVMTNLLMDAPLNNQKLEVIRGFIDVLGKMVERELQEYLLILRKRNVLTDRICGYLRNLIQTNIFNLDINARHLLLKCLYQVMIEKCGRMDFPSITKYCHELKNQQDDDLYVYNVSWRGGGHGGVTDKENQYSPVTDLQQLSSNVEENKNIQTSEDNRNGSNTQLPKSSRYNTSTPTTSSNHYASSTSRNLGNEHNNNDIYPNESAINRRKPQKMSPIARAKLNRLFLRLKTSLYFSRRLKFYQKMFRH